MRKNYFLALLGLLCCTSVVPQASNQTYKDSTSVLAKAANEALSDYDYNSSIEQALSLIDLASREKDYYNLHHGYNVLGITYEILEDTLRARENYQKALEYAEASKNDTLLWYAYNNLGNIYSSDKRTVQKGLAYYKKALSIAGKTPDAGEALTPVVNLGWTYLENEEFDEAYKYLKRAEKILQKTENKLASVNLNILFGMYYSGKGNYKTSDKFFSTAINQARRDSLLVESSFAYKEYAKMLSASGKHEAAYQALAKHQEFKEDLFQEEKNLQREKVYGKFETEEYKRDLATAQREQQYKDAVIEKTREITVVMIISLLVMFIFLILLLRSNRIRKGLIQKLRDKNNELLASKEQAEKLTILKTRFFSTVSHELRTPLYGVVGLTSLLLEDSKDEKQKEDLKSLKFSADYLLALINDVLHMNKMESDLVHLEDVSFNIEELLKGILKSFETSGNYNRNRIELEIDPRIPRNLIGDSIRLSQVMMNLVGNAVKFTDKGKVWVKAEHKNCENGYCKIYFEVGDTGMGIPLDKQQEIFEEFSQLHTQNINYQGTGLGLTIVKKLLYLFNSEIHLESQPGTGSVFSFEIKFKQGADIPAQVVNEPASAENESLVRRVLIVDDNKINQIVTSRILEKRDFECILAGSGYEAIEILQKEQVDLVLMDVNMPGLNGMETTSEIRKFNTQLPIIALTAVEVGEMREEILSTGMNDIINKPYDIPQFFNTIFRNLLQPVA